MRLFDALLYVGVSLLCGLAFFGFGMLVSHGALWAGLFGFGVGVVVGAYMWND